MSKTKIDKAKLDSYIQRTAAGDRDSFVKLYDYVRKPVFLFALSIVKDYQTAEDVLQESMLRIAFNSDKYTRGTNPYAWVMSITRNLCSDALRSPTKHDLPLDDAEFVSDSKDIVKSTEEADEVLTALQVLSHQEREIVSLYIYAGFSQVEIAKTLEIPYTRVRSQYKYALEKMRKYFNEVDNYENTKKYSMPIKGVRANTDSRHFGEN
ncbi:MAG: RNA polymerase sigma factor [Oscillospiraceae bacterium]|nr:RNA polymerase sigma factor [Oscillospiraceae bacterium]